MIDKNNSSREYYSSQSLKDFVPLGEYSRMAKKRKKTNRNDSEPFPLTLRAWRDLRGWTQDELEDRSGVSQSQIAKMEKGDVGWSGNSLIPLAIALGCEPGDLFVDPAKAESEIVRYVRKLDERTAQRALKILETILEDEKAEDAA